MPHIEVSFPHRGSDGTKRQPGDVVYVSSAEARRLTSDSVAQVVPTPKPEKAPTAESEGAEKPKSAARTRKADPEPTI
ncbi:hypothetical protein [Allonocardiopsis opalescens]|uniref:Uncharacterized protein n=1 Tax=Allonocardiopsis opalescens TaxID=1144618 RepID=A0A2T0PSV8_9ACTN|nr:hypothetical protein [Allonocardiopsis opalescens]PRX91984.1 hypothetical protein CLV72_11257 [Allonocardiopsis opalescens]